MNGEQLQIALISLSIAVFPIPVMVMIVALLSPDGKRKGWWFLGGWLVAILGLGAALLLLLNPEVTGYDQQPAALASWLRIIAGGGLIGLGVQKWVKSLTLGRTGKKKPESPKWLQAIQNMKLRKAMGVGAALIGLNPKNIVLILAAASMIVSWEVETSEQLIVWLAFSLVASLGVITPLLTMVLFKGNTGVKVLGSVQKWLEKNNTIIIVILCFLIGMMMLDKGLEGVL